MKSWMMWSDVAVKRPRNVERLVISNSDDEINSDESEWSPLCSQFAQLHGAIKDINVSLKFSYKLGTIYS